MTGQAVAVAPAGTLKMQGIVVPNGVVDFANFCLLTERHTLQEQGAKVFAPTNTVPAQAQDTWELRKSDILADCTIRIVGTVVITLPTGTVATTARWPYDIVKSLQFTANGASNLINASGWKLKARHFMKKADLDDRGVSQTIGGTVRTQGTLSLASESWGVGQNTSAIAAGTYNVDLAIPVDVAEDEVNLAGAIFLATSSSDLTLTVNWAGIADLFTVTGTATVALSLTATLESTKYSIPMDNGVMVLPNLNLFHSIQQSRTTAIGNGENEIRIVGQGAGKRLLRVFAQTWNGAVPSPLAVNDTNYGLLSWRYATNEQPDTWTAQRLRERNEDWYNSDFGGFQGIWSIDFSTISAFRDAPDMGTHGELRIVETIQSGVTLTTSPAAATEYVTETLYLAGQAA